MPGLGGRRLRDAMFRGKKRDGGFWERDAGSGGGMLVLWGEEEGLHEGLLGRRWMLGLGKGMRGLARRIQFDM
jgi:hypothetical protein